ncbi:cytochrome P450 [Pseudarthrobacter niigatensis]|uniref:Cytochrome P450 n=1 Tax=Pseudarthrobacter niigatensis TaxID=369935 RepID=A0AAJ1SPC7_9MICC|nr:cytochrome P450 [Pseudarthrobacter niigatensis]MDQ0144560.1 cytochrome P450 [Pseudarthrobacter niigatensis]MDQ0265206.1 cytochrome P450 [Pseudarthrobacter niigatensis]
MDSTQSAEYPLDPFPQYERMRAMAPVFQDSQSGSWHVFRYEDVQRVLSEHATFSSRMGGDNPSGTGQLFAASLITTDPPRHRQLRSLVTQAFTPKAVDALAPRIAGLTNELLDGIAAGGSADLIRDLAYPLPVIVISELLGIPAEDRERFKHWSDVIVSQTRTAPAGETQDTTTSEMVEYFLALIDRRRSRPGTDLISSLLSAEIGGQRLTVPELLGFCSLLLVAGNETTTNLIGNAVLCLAESPGTLGRLLEEPGLLPQALEEVLRFRSPVQSMYRVAVAETVLSGQRVPAGAPIVAWIGSANRDGQQFPAAAEFDIDRSPNRHLAFGHGIHFCLGAPLARLEARIALEALLTRLPGLSLAPGAELERMESSIVYGLKELPVTWQRA